MKKAIFFLSLLLSCSQKNISVFSGSITKPFLDEINRIYEKKTSTKVVVHYGGSGFVLSKMLMSRNGDVYISGSSDFMKIAEEKGAVKKETEIVLACLKPAIVVKKNNPQNVKSLDDLKKVKFAIANPENVCMGKVAVEIFEKSNLKGLEKEAVTYGGSCLSTFNLLLVGAVDAIIGWRIFEKLRPDDVEAIPLKYDKKIEIIAGVSSFAKEKAVSYIHFLASEESQTIIKEKGFDTCD